MELINKYTKPENIEELGDKKLPRILDLNLELYNDFMSVGFNILDGIIN